MLVCVLSVAPRHQQKGSQNPWKVCETEWSLQRSEEANSQAGVWPQPCCPPPNGTTSPLCITVARLRVISLAWEWHQQWQTVRTSLIYRWRELPQVSKLSKVLSELPKVLSWQTCFCRYKICHDAAKVCLSWQNFCCDKHVFVMTKYIFVVTNMCLSQQRRILSRQNFCHNKHIFVATKLLLGQIFVTVKLTLSKVWY